MVYGNAYGCNRLSIRYRAARYVGVSKQDTTKIQLELSDVSGIHAAVIVKVESGSISTCVEDIRNDGNLMGIVELVG